MKVKKSSGFTLVELLVTLSILAVLAIMCVPMTQLAFQRHQERELRLALREIRLAIDAYKRASDEGKIIKEIGSTGYPRDLEVLVKGSVNQRSPQRTKLYFLRRIPRDPFNTDSAASDSETWKIRSYSSEADDPQEGDDVYDVFSSSTKVGLNGIPYKKW